MRFNQKELQYLAQTAKKQDVDKEGALFLREKQEGLFKKGEVFTERWFLLRGNLLFYYKTKEKGSEVVGVIVLERCTVELDPDEDKMFSFQLVFEGDDRIQYLAAEIEKERDAWIQALHIASYECLKMQLECLREQLRAKTGHDPIQQPSPAVLDESTCLGSVSADEPVIEMCLRCDNLPHGGQGQEPNAMVVVSTLTPPEQTWAILAHSEIEDRTSNPVFMKTICMNWQSISVATRVRLSVYDVKERLTETMAQIGYALFTMDELLKAPESILELNLGEGCGTVTVRAWQGETIFEDDGALDDDNVDDVFDKSEAELLNASMTSTGTLMSLDGDDLLADIPSASRGVVRSKSSDRVRQLRALYDNISTRVYRFPTNKGGEVKVHEFMGESKLTFYVPKELLKIWIEEEKTRMIQLQDLGKLNGRHEHVRQACIDHSVEQQNIYTEALCNISCYEGPPFKPSTKRLLREMEFVPTNLHLQRMAVLSENSQKASYYDTITVGAFIAYPMRFKHGGLRRLILQFREQYINKFGAEPQVEKITELLNTVAVLRKDIHFESEGVSRAAVQGDQEVLPHAAQRLSDKVRQLTLVCESSVVEQSLQAFTWMKTNDADFTNNRRPATEYVSPNNNYADKNWRWTSADCNPSTVGEPWDIMRSNLEAIVVCMISKIDHLLKNYSGNKDIWMEEIEPLVTRTKGAVENMAKLVLASLTFKMVQELSSNVALWHSIKYRRDVIFSHALTTLITAFITKIRSSIKNGTFLSQIARIGIIASFEGLLSCHGDEMGMLEDMVIAVNDLNNVKFRIVHSAETEKILPRIVVDSHRPTRQGSSVKTESHPDANRCGIIVEVPAPPNQFHLLPHELQRGHLVKVTPVMFNIGLNEQATLAEKFGDNSLQEGINVEGCQGMITYYEKFAETFGEPAKIGSDSLPLGELMARLQHNVSVKKSKNVEILQLAEEICRQMNGLRFTSCKSAKDRTAMSITLEQVQILQRQHDLASHVFMGSLECMRSEGVRRENTYKNTGARKYAFNSLRVLSLPKLYRPPHGTYGNVQT
ncbi:inositol polyphosphate-4-phosphatase type I A-like isoform X2 [Lineus longissimus]|uniref:inositol polyphosphate-4-phosphatase type I A-like isoform X2 n=1 Tax=Lineus longissimus TaxID=88925 RepID=UPI00315D7435